jgi:cation diffusion facilitator family transporter
MHTDSVAPWEHGHTFGQDRPRDGERRTRVVTALTLATMVVEIAAGLSFGSMALLADGLHMGSHAVALGISALAYAYARRRAADPRFAFGTGKVNVLGGYTGAVLLGGFALAMAWESVAHLLEPVPIAFDWAIAVAVLGLLVNGASILVLGGHGRGDGHRHRHHDHHEPGHHHHRHHADDFNLRSAYLHVLADALTSLLAIVALLAGKYLGAGWLDPVMGIVGAALVARWAWGLLTTTGGILLDRQAPEQVRDAVRSAIEGEVDSRLADLDVWAIGPDLYAAALSVVTHQPCDPEHYKALLPAGLGVVHATVEVHECRRRPTTACRSRSAA